MDPHHTIHDQLIAHILGDTAGSSSDEVDRLLRANPTLRPYARRIEAMLSVMRADDTVHPPTAIKNAAKSLMHEMAEAPSRLDTAAAAVVRYLARLVHDSSAPAYGLRAGPASSRILLYESEGADLDLQIDMPADPITGLHVVTGQVASKRGEPGAIRVAFTRTAAPGTEPVIVSTDASGYFRAEIEPGNYAIELRLTDGSESIVDGVDVR